MIRQYTVGMRRPAALVWITVGSVGANVVLNAALLYGAGWGIAGIGAATSIVYLLSFLTLYALDPPRPAAGARPVSRRLASPARDGAPAGRARRPDRGHLRFVGWLLMIVVRAGAVRRRRTCRGWRRGR